MTEIWTAALISITIVILIVLVCAYADRQLQAFKTLSSAVVFPNGRLKLALSPYPDALLLEYIIRNNATLARYVETINVSWTDIEKGLETKQYDIAYGNKTVFGDMMGPTGNTRELYLYAPDLLVYDGFAVMVHDNDPLFQRFRDQNDLNGILSALNQRRIITAEATDHQFAIMRLFELCNLAMKHDTIMLAKSPGEALNKFLNREAGAFVGGITERLIAKTRGAIEAISQDVRDVGQREFNCLAYVPRRDARLKKFVANYLAASFVTSYKNLLNDKSFRANFRQFLYEEMPRKIDPSVKPLWKSEVMMTEENFAKMWSNWYKVMNEDEQLISPNIVKFRRSA